jgi:capsular polysaccharide export protein
MTSSRRVLFLQGLPGSFFSRLGNALRERGCDVYRINFNGGDQWDWPAKGAANYRGPARGWPAFLATYLRKHRISDIVLFGDCRPLHRMARGTAAGLGVTVHVFEEGYLRPDWVTLERGGVNGFSPLSLDPGWYREASLALPPVEDVPPLPPSLKRRWRETIAYYLAFTLLGWSFPYYRTHRPHPPLVEAAGWLTRLSRYRKNLRRSETAISTLQPQSYFVFPLQLDSDYQLRAHSDFDGMQPALAEVVASFAAKAPAGKRLAIKAHPLDNGLTDWRTRTLEYAEALGIADRVVFVDAGDLVALVENACGIVTVNSTAGTFALAAGVPVIALGRAIYCLEGLTHQGDLNSFWSTPTPPDADLYDAFRRVLAARCLLRGGFYTDERHAPLVDSAADRITDGTVTWIPAERQRGFRARLAASMVPAE